MAQLGRFGFLAIAVVFHLMYCYSIFDIYFVSPIVSGMREFSVDEKEAPARRLVLFVGDGLRADKAFQSFPDPSPSSNDTTDALIPRPLAPFLRSRVLEHGTFGVSHTRVPTESRPGHVALIAGLYEDVSAVMTGWKLNPVNFDSVFNRSRHTWSWGSPDILPMFEQGAVPGRVDADTYGAEAEDFTQDATHLDIWVFDKVKELFENAKTNATLNGQLREDKIVFFLHLLGLDTTGHSFRPYSKEYLHNIKVVDQGVEEITTLVEDFYGDGKTAFVFTADHGMSDWGSHGDGHPDNTRTPLVAWGSGVAKPIINKVASGHEDGFSADWGLSKVQRNDVAQADVAALMAYLVGLAFPVNSVGELPLAYIEGDLRTKAEALLVNARSILEMYRVKEEKKKSTELRYKPFPGLGDERHSSERRITDIRRSIDSGKYGKAIKDTDELIQLGLQGLRYLQTYDWLFLRTLVTVGYLGWIVFAITTVIDLHVLNGQTQPSRSVTSMLFFSSLLVILYAFLYIQKSSWTYYAYAIFPVMFWEEVVASRAALTKGKEVLFGHVMATKDVTSLVIRGLGFIGVLEALVQSYFRREIYTVCYFLAITWPAFYGLDFIKQNRFLVGTWACSCALMSVFTLLPANKVEDINLIMLGGGIMFTVGTMYLFFEKSILVHTTSTKEPSATPKADGFSRTILGVQVGLVGLAMFVTRSSVASIQAKSGLPLGTQIVGWVVLIASFTVPFLHGLQPNNNYIHRLVVIFLSFSPIFILLTISYEGLFYFAYFTTVVTWVRLEHRIYSYISPRSSAADQITIPKGLELLKPALSSASNRLNKAGNGEYRALSLADARISLFFLFLLQSAFFSTGNIASVSSFSLDAVYRLIPVFDPFSQGALLMFKILIPFAVISANLGILNRRLGVAPSALFMIVMAIGDVMTLNFFYMVRDEGSWLDIGTTISHFCIASGLCVFVAALETISEVFVSGIEFESDYSAKGDPNGVIARAANGHGKDRLE
ncbi:PigN-domain-containing protein [Patellaria atrata CBS 101060]|uniref:GPI ethanolamine phosphate transferase 1 n=1 Tax=Patellaria atrata CBS 101060 TaxID=1346257 RepID=A0A9P4S4X5_9PEZI|nr:PigN-domain-containing protein [Patellaria atrata CBS 101060]